MSLIPLRILRSALAPAVCCALLCSAWGAAVAQTLLPRFSTWSYRDTPVALPANWMQPAYDDSGWPTGPAPLGYGETYITTTVPYGPDPLNRYPTTYFRIPLDVPDPASVYTLTLLASYDDGFILYLNGGEILRRSMPAGPVDYTTLGFSHEGTNYESVNLNSAIGALVPGQNLLAVELHQASANNNDLVLDLELVASGPTLTRGPYLQRGSDTGVTVRWRTATATDTRVRYGLDPAALTSFADGAAGVTEHEVPLTGLAPDTRYFYSVGTSGTAIAGGDSTFTFVTAPVPGPAVPTRLWILGDSGTANTNAAAVRDAFLGYTGARGADLWLMLGDNAYNAGTDAEYQNAVFNMYPAPLKQWVLWPTRGNHDVLYSGVNNDYYEVFSLPVAGESGGVPSGSEAYYSFDRANIHFVCLDSEGTDRSTGGAMAQWLRADLAATTRDWVIAFWHHPPYTKGSHDSDNDADSGGRMRDMRANLLPILDSTGVDLVLTGHSHSYERSFLLDRHYGPSSTLLPSMVLDAGDGRPDGDGAYEKPTLGPAPNEGAVHAVAGSSGQISGGALNHPVMYVSLNELGSMVIDVDGNRLDARFLNSAGAVRDSFTILKGTPVGVPQRPAPESRIALLPARPNPSGGETRLGFALAQAGPVRLAVLDALGREQRVLVDRGLAAGRHEVAWDGADGSGRRLAPGVFFVVLETAEGLATRKVVRVQ